MPTLSVIIITKNEAHDIRDCLESVKWVDEIIVVDSGSTDGTQALCREYTEKVFETDWPGFGPQKNRAQELATSEWILCVDADERVTKNLKDDIITAISQTIYDAYAIPFRSTYCGKEIKFGDWRGDVDVVLYKKAKGCFTDSVIHERVVLVKEAKVGRLKSFILHNAFKDLEEVLNKVNLYSTETAKLRFQAGKKGSLMKAILHGGWSFFRSYLFQLGFLDGREGFMLAVSNAEGTYYRYLKLFYLSHPHKKLAN